MNRALQSGFTLIELMVSLTLLGLVVAVLAGAVRTGLFGASIVDERSQAIGDVRLAHGLIRRQVETARPLIWIVDRAQRVAFEGRSEAVDFLTVISPHPGLGGPYAVRLAKDGNALVMLLRLSSGEASAFDFSRDVERTVLLEDVAAVRFTYFGAAARDANAKWQASWTGRDRLPQAVKVQIDFVGDRRAAWPELTVPLMIGPVRP
jgi:general secretion pathway protein J